MESEAAAAAAPYFNSSNLEALATHLPDGGLSQEIVAVLRPVTTDAEAQGAIEEIAKVKVVEERARLDAKTPDA